MNKFLRLVCTIALATGTFTAHAEVPQLINYQGRVAVIGANFSGTGQFKFALVNEAGTTTYWSNDGTSSGGSQPATAIALQVTGGLYSVLLGDATLANMSVMPAAVFTNADVRLRVWFNDGANGSQLMVPDQRIAAVGYAIMAGNVPDGAITGAKIAGGAVGPAQLADGAVGPAKLAPGAAAANLAAGGHTPLEAGGLVLSDTEDNSSLTSAGYVRIGTVQTGDTWQRRMNAAPSARYAHTGVWTGSEMIVWGGFDGATSVSTGGRYNPALNTWTPTSDVNAPLGRNSHTAVWTGSEMIIYGGYSTTELNSGARYGPNVDAWVSIPADVARSSHTAIWTGTEMICFGGNSSPIANGRRYHPTSNTWSAASATNQAAARHTHTATWTGTEMIIWGGVGGGTYLGTGGRYTPSTNTWSAMTPSLTPAPRAGHTAVWTGSEMMIWGGWNGSTVENNGARYHPSSDSWVALPSGGGSRTSHTAVWTGEEMVVWGGSDGPAIATGARFSPAGNAWTPVATGAAPAARYNHTAVWSGSDMIIFGGFDGTNEFADGGRYRPSPEAWLAVVRAPPAPRRHHTAVWTGSEMIVWGGSSGLTDFADGGRYDPASNRWTSVSPVGAPSPRSSHTAVWSGSEMIIWGGAASGGNIIRGDGGRYNPAANSWNSLSSATGPAPSPRWRHTAVWTGSEMIVWGGSGNSSFNDGARYHPGGNNWTSLASAGGTPPTARGFHTAVWTGTEMIIWGGLESVTSLNTGARYALATNSWTSLASASGPTPAARRGHSAVWAGSRMIIWGGSANNGGTLYHDGGSYDLVANSWTPISLIGAPIKRQEHSAVWTGTEMIVWGGAVDSTDLNDGGRYTPATNTWTAITTADAPTARAYQTAIWTGSSMIIWGGRGSSGASYFNDIAIYTPSRVMHLFQKP